MWGVEGHRQEREGQFWAWAHSQVGLGQPSLTAVPASPGLLLSYHEVSDPSGQEKGPGPAQACIPVSPCHQARAGAKPRVPRMGKVLLTSCVHFHLGQVMSLGCLSPGLGFQAVGLDLPTPAVCCRGAIGWEEG